MRTTTTTGESAPGPSISAHVRRALELGLEYFQIQIAIQKSAARNRGVRFGAVAVLGAFAAVWAELTVFFALNVVAHAWLAALLVLALNGAGLGLALALGPYLGGGRAACGRALELEQRKDDAATELKVAREELRESVIGPVQRFALPVGMGVAFVGALLLARAVIPARQAEDEFGLTEGDVRNLI